MSKHENFGNGMLSNVTNHIYFFMMMTIYFLLTTLPTMAFILIIEPSLFNIFPVSLFGPSLVAIIACMIKFNERDIEKGDIPVFSDFILAYKSNFVDSLKVATPYVVIMFILYTNIVYFTGNQGLRIMVILAAFVVGISATLCATYMLLMTSKFKFKLKDLFKLSMFCMLKDLKATVTLFVIYLLIVASVFIIPPLLLLLVVSIIVYLLVGYTHSTLEYVKHRFTEDGLQNRAENN